ncbi:MAG: hypothetical protein ABI639_16260 [Thermoanaerobaculia bacterium]
MTPPIRAFCLGHRLPIFSPGVDFTMVTPVALGLAGEIVIADDGYPRGSEGALSEYAQFFGLAERIAAGDVVADSVYLFQYRKFLSFLEGPRRSTNIPYAFVADAAGAEALMPSLERLLESPEPILVGPSLKCSDSISDQYASSHLPEDFLGLIAACESLELLQGERLDAFRKAGFLLPSPTLCRIDAPFLVELAATLAAVWREFAERFYVRREGYQRRVGGFLLERLHGFLLRERMAAAGRSEPAAMAAMELIVISDSPHIVLTGFDSTG